MAESHGVRMDATTVEELTEGIISELTVGTGGTDIKCGSIGEIGCSTPLHGEHQSEH